MAEKDIIVPGLKIDAKNTSFQLQDLIKIIRSWGNLNQYGLTEKSYGDRENSKGKNVDIDWVLNKDVDDYACFRINLKCLINGKHITIKKRGKGLKGDIKIMLVGILLSDKDSKWEAPIYKFLRSFYDLFQKDKFKAYGKKLDEEVHSLYNELKAFLNLHSEK